MTNSHRFIRAFLCGALFYLLAAFPSSAATLLPNGEQTFVDANGSPLAAGTVDFYVPGGFVRKNTWLSSTSTNPNLNANPVVLDAAGRAVIYGIGCYRQIVKTSAGVTQWDKTICDTSTADASWGGLATGTPNAIIVTADNFTGTDGQVIRFIAASNNSGPTTVNPTVAGVAFGNVTVLVDSGVGPVACTGGEIVAGNVVTLIYDSNLGAFHLSTLTTVTAGAGLSTAGVGSSGGTGATSVTLTSVEPVNAQTGTTYTLLNTDNAKLVTFSNTAAIAVTLPAATGNFGAGFHSDLQNLNPGVATLTPASGTINGLTSIALSQFGSGHLVSNGTNWFLIAGTAGTGQAFGGYSNLKLTNVVGTENSQYIITADYVSMFSTGGFSLGTTSVSVTCNMLASGLNGLDTGAVGVTSSWYYFYVISNGVAVPGCLASLSATAPTMPSGYTFKRRVGANKTSAGSLHRVLQYNDEAQYVVSATVTTSYPVVGVTTGTAFNTFSISTFVPSTASVIKFFIGNQNNAQVAASPNNLTSNAVSFIVNPSPVMNSGAVRSGSQGSFTLESTNMFAAADSGAATVAATGWKDRL